MRTFAFSIVLAALSFMQHFAQADAVAPSYALVPNWPALPAGTISADVASVCVDSHNHVIAFQRSDKQPIVIIDAATGALVHSFGDGMFINAHGLTTDREDNIWVTDSQRHQVFKFTHDGKLLMTLGEEKVPGWDAKHFDQPTDLAVCADGSFYVSDGYGNSRVAKFSADGTFQFEWGKKGSGPGEFDCPHSLALDAAGNVLVADRSNQRIQIFSAAGKFIRQIGTETFGKDGRPWGLSLSAAGHLFVIDGGDMLPETPVPHAQALELDLEGHVLAHWGAYGTAPGQFLWGHDIAVGPDGAVYTVEVRDGDRVQKFIQK